MERCRAILIAGPTASGKSALALRLAERHRGTVINADSMQVYRELRILTARPTAEEEARAPHALYGFVSAREAYSVGRYVGDAGRAIEAAEAQGRLPVIVGGTGLYFKALLEGLSPIPPIPAGIRAHWRAEARRIGAAALHQVLAERDPVMGERLRPTDAQRVVRALEVLDATGRSLADWQCIRGRGVIDEREAIRLVLLPDRESLYRRCEARFDEMMRQGALDEVAAVRALGLDPGLPAMTAHGVPHLLAALAGATDMETAVACAKGDTRRYAKRQLTWIRRNMKSWNRVETQEMESVCVNVDRLIKS
ncbi:MAG: tRNA (adenosine(37)-N6)-dimethylallyltransferase MiaA [Hyphomicrobiaceae bacterium]|nr:tRNA (adenosine(37)-N6)-dimethylallyltransferase MiaA [Hyphomicrobiaceae bacterium]